MDKMPDMHNDFFVGSKEVDISFKKDSTAVFSDLLEVEKLRFHYSADLYSRFDGTKYYIFRAYKDCTLFIIDCGMEIYEILEEEIELNDNIEIWQPFANEFQLIPLMNRMPKGF